MPNVYLDRLLDERTSLTGVMQTLRDRATAEERDITEQERSEIARLQERCVEIDGLLTEHHAQNESARAFAQLQQRIESSRERVPEQRAGQRPPESTSFGQQIAESEELRSYPGRGVGQAVHTTGMTAILETRALITTANLAIPSFVLPPKVRDVVIPPLLQVVDVVNVGSGAVEWVEITGDPEAAVVPEGTPKPEATLTFAPKSETLDTIAHWVQITRQALEDAPYVRSVVEGKLRRGLLLKITNDITAALAAATLPTAEGADLLAAIRVGVGTVQDAGHVPNAVLLNPADWAALDISVMGGTLGGPTVGTNFWGLRPIASGDQPAGTATVGDFEAGVTYFDRNVTDVFVTDSHADLFIKNILVILAEARGKSAVTDTTALCECAATVIP